MKYLRILLSILILFGCFNFQSIANPILQSVQSNNPDELIRSGYSLYQQRKFTEAIVFFEKAAQLRPNDFRPLALIGASYEGQDKFKSASEVYAKAIALQPKEKMLYLAKASADSIRKATDEALAACRKALELDPNYAEAYAVIGNTLRYDENRRSEAISAYESAIKSDPKFLESYEPLGEILVGMKNEKGAELIFKKAMEADPKKMCGRNDFGRLLVKQGRLVEARELWKGRTSDEELTMPKFIELLEWAENLKRATDALAKAPNNPEVLVQMGLAVMEGNPFIRDGRHQKAIRYFNQALKLKPAFAKAQYGICKAHLQFAKTPDEKKIADQELAKLRKMDKSLALELEEYRKEQLGGILLGSPVDFNK